MAAKTVKIDSSSLDEVKKKAEEIVNLLQQIKNLIGELAVVVDGCEDINPQAQRHDLIAEQEKGGLKWDG